MKPFPSALIMLSSLSHARCRTAPGCRGEASLTVAAHPAATIPSALSRVPAKLLQAWVQGLAQTVAEKIDPQDGDEDR